MKNGIKLPGMKTCVLLLLLLFAFTGCAGPKIAADLLANVKANDKPLANNSSVVNVTIDSHINNYERIDESVKESLELALANATMFGTDSSKSYKIDASILVASQSPWSFGSFEGKLEIRYLVHDPDNKEILDKTIYTVAGSDKGGSGPARSRRSRAVNISKNVLQFVDDLQNQLRQK